MAFFLFIIFTCVENKYIESKTRPRRSVDNGYSQDRQHKICKSF